MLNVVRVVVHFRWRWPLLKVLGQGYFVRGRATSSAGCSEHCALKHFGYVLCPLQPHHVWCFIQLRKPYGRSPPSEAFYCALCL